MKTRRNCIKILHLCSSAGFFGAENVILELCQQAKNHRYDAVTGVIENSYNPHLELVQEATNKGIQSQIFPCRKRLDIWTVKAIAPGCQSPFRIAEGRVARQVKRWVDIRVE